MVCENIAHSGCVALYPLSSNSDISGNGFHLDELAAKATYISGKFGNAADFDLSDDILYTFDILGVNLGTKVYGLSFWLKIHAQPGAGAEFIPFRWESYISSTNRFVYLKYYLNKLEVRASNYGTVVDYEFALNQWYKIDIDADGTTCRVYVDGNLEISSAVGTLSPGTNDDRFYLSYNQSLNAEIDDCMLLNYTRSAEQIMRQYAFETGVLL